MRLLGLILAVAIFAVFAGAGLFNISSQSAMAQYVLERGFEVREFSLSHKDKIVRAVNASWAGYTTTTYTGQMAGAGGFKAANQICQSNYPGSRWAGVDDLINLGTSYPWSVSAWIQFSHGVFTDNNSCSSWSSNSPSYTGPYVTISTLNTISCDTSFKLACVYGGDKDDG